VADRGVCCVVADATGSEPAGQLPEVLVDLGRFQEISGGDEQELRELIALYLGEAQGLMERLEAALVAGASADVRRLAHELRGASLNLGLIGMLPPLEALERLTKAGSLGGSEPWLAQARQQWRWTRRFPTEYAHLPPSATGA
jgi:HPt (histidine-containing phosphotransfer) domain-containing protein